jgi:hypothetical protein
MLSNQPFSSSDVKQVGLPTEVGRAATAFGKYEGDSAPFNTNLLRSRSTPPVIQSNHHQITPVYK